MNTINETTNSKISIIETEGNELYHQYPGQTKQQDCYVELNAETGRLFASYNGEIGNAVPFRVWHGHCLRWRIPALKSESCNNLLREIVPFAERVCEGYESVWNGNDDVAKYDDDAEKAKEEIESLCEKQFEESDIITVWSADDWFAQTDATELGIDKNTTDEQLDEIEKQQMEYAESDGVDEIRDIEKYLRRVRDQLRSL